MCVHFEADDGFPGHGRGLSVTSAIQRLSTTRIQFHRVSRLMKRAALLRVYLLVAISVTAMAMLWTLSTSTWATAQTLLFYAALIAIAAWVRVDDEGSGFEAAVAFAAILVLHDPAVALVSVFAGTAAYLVVRDARRRT